MAILRGSRTEANLKAAFAGESQARNKYSFAADKARDEGLRPIAEVFYETAGNEKEHGEIWYKILHGGYVPDTVTNLKDAADGEDYENTEMYPEYAKIAYEEVFPDIAYLFEQVGRIEGYHRDRFRKLLNEVEEDHVYSRDSDTIWVCTNCGYTVVAKEAPIECPVCTYPQEYSEPKCKGC